MDNRRNSQGDDIDRQINWSAQASTASQIHYRSSSQDSERPSQSRRTDGFVPVPEYNPLDENWVPPPTPDATIDVEEALDSWRDDTLLSLLSSRGSAHFSTEQYGFVRDVFGSSGDPSLSLATYDRLKQFIRPFMERYALPRPVEHPVPAAFRSRIRLNGSKDDTLLVVPPSEWAIHDVRDPAMYDDLFGDSSPTGGESIESSHIVTQRENITSPTRFIYTLLNGETVRSYSRDTISLLFDDSDIRHHFTMGIPWIVGHTDDKNFYANHFPGYLYRHGLSRSPFTLADAPQGYPIPGDMCVELTPTAGPERYAHRHILIYRQLRTSEQWQHTSLTTFNHSPVPSEYIIDRVRNVVDIHHEHRVNGNNNPPNNRSPNQGSLNDGSKYLVYRFLLYADGFTPQRSSFTHAEVNGVYMLPVGIPSRKKFFTRNVHCVSVTPRGVSSNTVLHAIVPDILRGHTQGFRTRAPTGDDVTVFLDCMGFVGDYPAITQVLDTKKPTANAPCTLCSFHTNIVADRNQGSKYAASSTVHAKSSAAVRTRSRSEAIRPTLHREADYKAMGLIHNNVINDIRSPLLYLDRELERISEDVKLNSNDHPVVPTRFCAYQSTVVGPDHCFYGLMKNTLLACTEYFSAALRLEIDARLRLELRLNGLLPQSKVFNHKPGTSFNLHTSSISSTFALFFVGYPVFRIMFEKYIPNEFETNPLLPMYSHLHKLAGETYFWPQKHVDTPSAFSRILGVDKAPYHATLQRSAVQFVSSVDAVIRRGFDVRQPAHVDKPNVHRLLELYMHTIPAYGHVRHVQELVFEHAHQPLKRIWEQHNARNRHYAMLREIIYDDLFSRLHSTYRSYVSTEGADQLPHTRHLCDLLFGRSISEFQHSEFASEIAAKIESIFDSGPVIKALTLKAGRKKTSTSESIWAVRARIPLQTFTNITTNEHRAYYLSLVQKIDPSLQEIPPFFTYASRGPTGSHRLHANTACQVLVTPEESASTVIRPTGLGTTLMYFTIRSIFTTPTKEAYAEVVQLLPAGDDKYRLTNAPIEEAGRVLRLNNSVRRVAHIHDCTDVVQNVPSCVVSADTGEFEHASSLLDGGRYYLYGRANGYPPRSG